MIALVAFSPLAVVVGFGLGFGLAFAYVVVDGIHQNRTNPAQRHPLSKGVQRRRAVGK